jgi:hypothetical protein
MPRRIRCDQPGLRFILNYCSQRSSGERIENGTDRSNARNRAALRRPKPASNERPVSLATSSHARGAALGNKSSPRLRSRPPANYPARRPRRCLPHARIENPQRA